MFEIRIDTFDPISVMIMANSLPAVTGSDIHYLFDMKGSSINRAVLKHKSHKQLIDLEKTGGEVLKDLDYVRLKEIKRYFKISPDETK